MIERELMSQRQFIVDKKCEINRTLEKYHLKHQILHMFKVRNLTGIGIVYYTTITTTKNIQICIFC